MDCEDPDCVGSGACSDSDGDGFPDAEVVIPTLSEWGLLGMAGLLGIVGFIVIRRRKVTV